MERLLHIVSQSVLLLWIFVKVAVYRHDKEIWGTLLLLGVVLLGIMLWDCVMIGLEKRTDCLSGKDMCRLNEQRLRIIYDQIDDVIFEWDMEKDTVHYSPMFEKRYGYNLNGGYSLLCGNMAHIHPEDISRVLASQAALRAGAAVSEVEYRIRCDCPEREAYTWCRTRVKTLFNLQGKPYWAVGALSDIEDSMQKIVDLEERVRNDGLTGLLNKTSMLEQLRERLTQSGNEQRVAIMVDIDNFRQLNQEIGHFAADGVLRDFGWRIRSLLGPRDLGGRFGGDEFVIYLEEVPTSLDKWLTHLRDTLSVPSGGATVSCSIGAAVYPLHGDNMDALFRNADRALYQSKNAGKRRYSIYTNPKTGSPLNNQTNVP